MTRNQHNSRPRRESLRKRLGVRKMRIVDARDNGCCIYCGATADTSGAHMHLDHIICRVAGGPDEITNLVTACRKCNTTRRDMTMPQWAAYAATHLELSFTADSIIAHAEQVAA